MDLGKSRSVARSIAFATIFLTLIVGTVLSAVLPNGLAAVVAFVLVGPGLHYLVGTIMNRWPGSDGTGRLVIYIGLAYPTLVWIGGTIYVGSTRSLWQAALVFVAPLVLFVIAVVVFDPDRGPKRRARSGREAIAAEHGWRFVADGSEVLSDHWATREANPKVAITATAVLAGEIDGWPVTICDIVARHGLRAANRTVTYVVHLPVALPDTFAGPPGNMLLAAMVRADPWTSFEWQGRSPVQEVHLVSADQTFADRLATPEVRRTTLDGDLLFWRIKGRDLTIAQPTRGRQVSTEETLRTTVNLVRLAQALPIDVINAYGTRPDKGLPFREPQSNDTRSTG